MNILSLLGLSAILSWQILLSDSHSILHISSRNKQVIKKKKKKSAWAGQSHAIEEDGQDIFTSAGFTISLQVLNNSVYVN